LLVKDKYFLKTETKGKDNCYLALIAMEIIPFWGEIGMKSRNGIG
jgi:hypothetical protein